MGDFLGTGLNTLEQAPRYLIASVALILLVGQMREKYRAHIGYESERKRPVGMERLATGAALDANSLAQWQSERVLYVEHGTLGRVSNARTMRPIREGLNSILLRSTAKCGPKVSCCRPSQR